MAFKLTNLRPVGAHEASGVQPVLWTYFNEDGDAVTGAGYLEKGCGVKAKDQVMVIAANGQSQAWHYASVADGVITLTAE